MSDDLPSGLRIYELAEEAIRIQSGLSDGRNFCLTSTEDRFLKTLLQVHASSSLERHNFHKSIEKLKTETQQNIQKTYREHLIEWSPKLHRFPAMNTETPRTEPIVKHARKKIVGRDRARSERSR